MLVCKPDHHITAYKKTFFKNFNWETSPKKELRKPE